MCTKNNWRKGEFYCHKCEKRLDILEDYPYGNNNHYWHLDCGVCEEEYFFDTMDFTLESLTDKRMGIKRSRKR